MQLYSGCLRNLHYPGNSVLGYLNDTTGIVRYRFNDFGFRATGLELHPTQSILICGCSCTFGVGLPVEETWGNIFAEHLSGAKRKKIGLWNLAQGGASNDYISRMIMSQLSCNVPRAVFVMFTFLDRAEFNSVSHVGECIGKWNTDEYATRYFAATSPEDSLIQTLKNILLVQLACKSFKIPLMFYCLDLPNIEELKSSHHPAVRQYAGLINFSLRIEGADLEASFALDIAFDGVHPGTKSNSQVGRLIASEFSRSCVI